MSSPTLLHIVKRWFGEFNQEGGVIKLPFDIEQFCAENDKALYEAKELLNKALHVGAMDVEEINIFQEQVSAWLEKAEYEGFD